MMSSINRSRYATGLAALFLLTAAGGCSRERPSREETWLTMSTFASVTAAGDDAAHVPAYAGLAQRTMTALADELTIFEPDSNISRMNANAGVQFVPFSLDAIRVLEACSRYGDVTGGAFDPTAGALLRLWGFRDDSPPSSPPGDEAIRAVLETVGYRNIILKEREAMLAKTGVFIDLGGIAKGYAVDACFDRLVKEGATDLMVNLGGNIRCTGLSRSNRPWRVGVRNPFNHEQIIGMIELTDGWATATSGNYEQFITIAGKRYAHILDPRSGRPVQDIAGVTVVAHSAMEADVMSTALFVLGPDDAASALKQLPDCHVLFVPDVRPLRILVSPGFNTRFTPNPEFAARVTVLP